MIRQFFILSVFFIFSESFARLPNGQDGNKADLNNKTEANISTICLRYNLSMNQIVKCIQAGSLWKNAGYILHPSAKTKIKMSSLTNCDPKSTDAIFSECLKGFLKKFPQSAQSEGEKCWQHINETEFSKCMGWIKSQKVELEDDSHSTDQHIVN